MEVMNYYGNFDETSVIIAQRRCKFSDSDVSSRNIYWVLAPKNTKQLQILQFSLQF